MKSKFSEGAVSVILSGLAFGVTGGTTLVGNSQSLFAYVLIVVGCLISACGGFLVARSSSEN